MIEIPKGFISESLELLKRMRIAFLDLETTGLDVLKDNITELAIIVTNGLFEIQTIHDWLVKGPTVTQEITELTGITNDLLNENGKSIVVVANEAYEIASKCDYLVAHNGTNFDRLFWERQIDKNTKYNWIDTSVDVPYPKRITTRKLTHLAAEHGFLNPFPHRAVFDVMTMLRILSKYDINEVIRISKTPSVTLIADVNYHTKEPAKAAGFRWYADEMKWKKTLKEDQIEEYPFAVIRAEGQSPATGEAK